MIFFRFKHKDKLCLLTVLFLCLIVLQGCEPLRKKFIRQKDRDDNENIEVVFEPKDYSPENFTPEDRYTENYNLWVLWGKSLEETIDDGSRNEKRYKYFLEKGLEALVEMKAYLKEPKKSELNRMIEEFQQTYKDFAKPYITWNMVQIRNRINSNSIKIRTTFNPKDVQGFFIDQE